MKGWSKTPLTLLALVVLLIGSARYFGFWEAHSGASEAILSVKLKEADQIREHFLLHLGDSWSVVHEKGRRKLSASAIDDCYLDEAPTWRRLIMPLVQDAPPLVAEDFPSFDAIVLAATQPPRSCPIHSNERPSKREWLRDDGRWLTERWTFYDGCWADAYFDRASGQWQIIFRDGCKH